MQNSKLCYFLTVYYDIYLDIGECSTNPCHANADCTNSFGSFTCKCRTGYTGNGITVCDGER